MAVRGETSRKVCNVRDENNPRAITHIASWNVRPVASNHNKHHHIYICDEMNDKNDNNSNKKVDDCYGDGGLTTPF